MVVPGVVYYSLLWLIGVADFGGLAVGLAAEIFALVGALVIPQLPTPTVAAQLAARGCNRYG
jgi:hypothetical protein